MSVERTVSFAAGTRSQSMLISKKEFKTTNDIILGWNKFNSITLLVLTLLFCVWCAVFFTTYNPHIVHDEHAGHGGHEMTMK